MLKNRKILWIGGLVAVSGVAALLVAWAVGGTEFYYDFRGQPIPGSIRLQGPQAGRFVTSEAEGLRITLPRDRVNRDAVGFSLPFEATGDFEATATFEILKAETPDSGYGVGVTMGVDGRARISRFVRAKGTKVILWDFWPVVDGVRKMEGGAFPCQTQKGRMRLTRRGTSLDFLWSPGTAGDDDFEQIHNVEYGTDHTTFFNFLAESCGEPCAVDVRVLEFRVRSRPATAGLLPWLGGAVAAAAVLGAGLVVLKPFIRMGS